MINEYSRTELLIGSENMEKLKKASVAVFGVGGVGSHCIEALARCGIGRLILIDNDDVSLTNINRQSIAYHSTIGRMKTDVMRERIKDIDPNIKVETYETFVLPDNAKELLEQNAQHKDWCCTEELMKTTKDGKALYLHCLPADINGVSCKDGEVEASVFDRYRDPLYKEASYKPYVIAAMIMLAKFADPAEILKKLEEKGTPRVFK